jgi:hypothetical protein
VVVTRYALGVVLTLLAVVPMQVGVRAVRKALLPGWSGPPAWVADAVAGIATFLVAAQLAGAVGLFGALPVALLTALAGGAGVLAAPRLARHGDAADVPEVRPSVLGRATRPFAVAVVAVAVAPWAARTVPAARYGMGSIDTLWYHLPAASRFVQDGSVFRLQSFDAAPTTFFYPQGSALVHGFGLSAFDSDLLSPFLNLGWLALALLAGWCIGRPRGLAPLTMAGVAVLLSTPVFAGTQPGGAYNDITSLALTLCAIALLLGTAPGRAYPPLPAVALSAAAVGAVLGTKWSGLASVGALVVAGVVLAPRGQRVRAGLVWVAGVGVVGGAWFVRNLVAIGNPLPPLGGDLGPISIPKVRDANDATPIAHFLFDGRAWREDFLPGLGLAFGVLWAVLVACIALGLVLAVVRGRDLGVRVLGVVGVVVIAAYVVGPQFISVFGRPTFFFTNLRYPAIGLALGLVLLPLALPRRLLAVVAAVYAGLLLVLQTDPTLWPTGLRDRTFSKPIPDYAVVGGVAAGAAVLLVGLALTSRRPSRAAIRAAVTVVALGLLAGGYALQRYDDDHRYTAGTHYEGPTPPRAAYAWAQRIDGKRIGVVGDFFQYPFTGRHQSNHVQYLSAYDDRGVPERIDTCREWRRQVNHGHYDFVVVARNPAGLAERRERGWTAAGPGGEQVLQADRTTIFRITGRLDPAGCPRN